MGSIANKSGGCMGVTILCNKSGHSIDMSSSGFCRLRKKIAELTDIGLGQHYALLIENIFRRDDKWYEEYDNQLKLILSKNKISIKIIDFLYQSDIKGKIHYGACKQILKAITDYDDNFVYGHTDCRKNATKFKDFVQILQESINTKSDVVWR